MLKGKSICKIGWWKRQIIEKSLRLVPYELEALYNIDDLDNDILERLN